MKYLGKGLGTVGIWGGVTLASNNAGLAGEYAIGVFIFLALAACLATVAMWYSN